MFLNFARFTLQKRTTVTQISGNISTLVKLVCEYGVFWYVVYLSSAVGVTLFICQASSVKRRVCESVGLINYYGEVCSDVLSALVSACKYKCDLLDASSAVASVCLS